MSASVSSSTWIGPGRAMAKEMPTSEMTARAERHFMVIRLLDGLESGAIDRGREGIDGSRRRRRRRQRING